MLRKALQINPENYTAFNGIAAIYFKKGKYNLALKYCQKALDIEPNCHSFILLGKAYYRKADYKKALEYFEEGKKLDPQNKKMQKYINLVTKKLY